MLQSENPAYAMPAELIIFFAKVQGAGAATAPTRAPTTFSNTSWKGFMFGSNNFVSLTAADIATSGTGLYTAKLRDVPGHVIEIIPTLSGADSKRVQVTDYNNSTQVISFKTTTAAGVLADLATTDFVTFTIFGQKVKPTY